MKTWKLTLTMTKRSYEQLFDDNVKKFIDETDNSVLIGINSAILHSANPNNLDFEDIIVLTEPNYKDFCNKAKDILQTNTYAEPKVWEIHKDTPGINDGEYLNNNVLWYLRQTINTRE